MSERKQIVGNVIDLTEMLYKLYPIMTKEQFEVFSEPVVDGYHCAVQHKRVAGYTTAKIILALFFAKHNLDVLFIVNNQELVKLVAKQIEDISNKLGIGERKKVIVSTVDHYQMLRPGFVVTIVDVQDATLEDVVRNNVITKDMVEQLVRSFFDSRVSQNVPQQTVAPTVAPTEPPTVAPTEPPTVAPKTESVKNNDSLLDFVLSSIKHLDDSRKNQIETYLKQHDVVTQLLNTIEEIDRIVENNSRSRK